MPKKRRFICRFKGRGRLGEKYGGGVFEGGLDIPIRNMYCRTFAVFQSLNQDYHPRLTQFFFSESAGILTDNLLLIFFLVRNSISLLFISVAQASMIKLFAEVVDRFFQKHLWRVVVRLLSNIHDLAFC